MEAFSNYNRCWIKLSQIVMRELRGMTRVKSPGVQNISQGHQVPKEEMEEMGDTLESRVCDELP